MLTLLSLLLSSLMLTFLFCMNPIMLGLWILLLTFTITLLLSFCISSWFAISLFLVYVSGMMIMFIYFAALIPSIPLLKYPTPLIFLTTFTISLLMMPPNVFLSFSLSPYALNVFSSFLVLFLLNNAFLLMFMVLMLFLIMVIVVKMTSLPNGPFRPFMYVLTPSQNPPCY